MLYTSSAVSLYASQVDVRTRPRGHSTRNLSTFTGNEDFGIEATQVQQSRALKEAAENALIKSFFVAAQSGDAALLKPFLSLKNFDFNVKNKEDEGKTALMYLAKLGLTSLVQQLLTAGAWPFSVKDANNLCAYDHAEGHPDVRKLMHTQVDDLKRRTSTDKNERDQSIRRASITKMMDDVCAVLYIKPEEQKEEKE